MGDRAALRIAVLAHLRHPIVPPFMGGMEAHAWGLVRALIARGHDVTLFASGDSDAALPLRPICAEHYDRAFPWADHHGSAALTAHLDAIHRDALDMLADGAFDVVHNNGLHRFPPRFARARRQPTVTSLHVPPFEVLHRAIHDSEAPWHIKTVTSAVQVSRWWDRAPPTAQVVPNGIELSDWPEGAGGGPFVWAGRIMANKGAGHAAAAARAHGLALTLYGAIEDAGYFQAEVAPHLGGEVAYGGHVGGARLARALGEARAFVFTPMWDEPFGLAAIEALATGTPVAAFDNGAAREVIGESGAFARAGDVDGLARAMGIAAELPRDRARRRAERRYTAQGMLEGYEAAYRRAISARDAPWPPRRYREIELPIVA